VVRNVIQRVLFLSFPVLLTAIISCSGGSPTVLPATITQTNPSGGSGSLIPQLRAVYPAGLTGVSPSNPGVVVVFSRSMENDASEMTFYLQLLDGATPVAYTINPIISSHSFSLKPGAALIPSHTYTIRIWKDCSEDNYPTHTLDLTNLPPSITPTALTSDYVDYQFTTGSTTSADAIVPTFVSSTPNNGATNVSPALTTGAIVFNLNDNITPMIDPSTVNPLTVTLYNITDGLTVDGWLEVTNAAFSNYLFHPFSALDYGKNYRLTLTTGIKDFSNNSLTCAPVLFSTIAASAVTTPNVTSWSLDALTSTSATISWKTDSLSIAHIEIDTGQTFVAQELTAHTASLGIGFSATLTPLAPDTDYSIRISADNNTAAVPPLENETYIVNYAFHTPPNGTSSNYIESTAGSVISQVTGTQINLNEKFLAWTDASITRIQYFDSSSGTPDTWDKWAAGGEQLFSSNSSIDLIPDGTGGVIVTRADGTNIYSNRVRDNAGSMQKVWVTDNIGVNINLATPTSPPRAAITYNGVASNIASGTNALNYIYDPAANFTSPAVIAGDYAINENAAFMRTVSSAPDVNYMRLSGNLPSALNGRNYRIAGSAVATTGTATNGTSGTTTFTSLNPFTVGDIITNASTWSFITSFTPIDTYTTNFATDFINPNPLSSHAYICNGTSAQNVLVDNGATNFDTSGVILNDIVMNTNASNYDWDYASSVYAGTAAIADGYPLLVLNNATKFMFGTTGQSYRIMRLSDPASMICCEIAGAFSGSLVRHTGTNFVTLGVQVGDIVYNPAGSAGFRSAKVLSISTTITPNDTLNLSSQPFTAVNQPFIVFSKTLVSYVWSDALNNIYIRSVSLDDGSSVYPAAVVPFTGASRNPYIVEDLSGNALIIYETIANTIVARDVRPSDASTVTGPSAPFSGYIKKVLPDSLGGAWVLYTSGSGGTGTAGVAHFTKNCSISFNSGAIGASSNPDIAILNTAGDVGLVYELLTAVSANPYTRIRYRAYSTSGIITTINVRSADYPSSQLNPRIGPDGSGGAHISWIDTKFLPASPYALFVQHIDNTYARRIANDYCISIPFTSGNSADAYNLISLPMYYKNGAVLPYSGMYFWLDGRNAASLDLYLQPTIN